MLFLTDSAGKVLLGGKASVLTSLAKRFSVPGGFVISPDEKLEPSEILSCFDSLETRFVAVRSSAVNEDGMEESWAGQLETFLNVERSKLLDRIEICRSSANSLRSQAYGKERGNAPGGVAVIVQKMVDSRISGVAFSRHPVTKADEVVIEAVYGLGDKLVGGETNPDTYILKDGVIVDTHLIGEEQIASQLELKQIEKLTRDVENELGYPVDIEWAYEDKGLYLLQARPITTL